MHYAPKVTSARPKYRFNLGKYKAILFDNIESAGKVQYLYIMTLFDTQDRPIYHVTSEINQHPKTGRTYFLGIFDGEKHMNMGASDQWADEEAFAQKAFSILQEKFPAQKTQQSSQNKSRQRPPAKQKKKKSNKKVLIGLIIAGVLIYAGATTYPYIDEYLSYKNAMSEQTARAFRSYYYDHQQTYRKSFDAAHLEEVLYAWAMKFPEKRVISHYLKEQERVNSPHFTRTEDVLYLYCNTFKELSKINLFLWKYPDSQYAANLVQLKDSIVQSEIKTITDKLNTSANAPANRFFSSLIEHMQTNDIYHINLNFNRRIDIRDIEEFSPGIVAELDDLTTHPLKAYMI
ncbi:MAG: hypothetical protein R3345_09645, partial [Fulvivirga sp.]|nr:hypothetical protein [Fulvivirga sp.]